MVCLLGGNPGGHSLQYPLGDHFLCWVGDRCAIERRFQSPEKTQGQRRPARKQCG